MNIDDAARATRKFELAVINDEYFVAPFRIRRSAMDETMTVAGPLSCAEAQAACDRMNLRAVLGAIREPTQTMVDAAPRDDLRTLHGAVYVYRAMIGALIAEVGQ